MFLAWLKFLGLLLLVYVFGTRVTQSADIIAEKKKWGRAFMGVVFISMITSFPELFTGASAAFFVKSADLAVGEIIGSCIFNLFIIALIDGLFRRKNLYQDQRKGGILPLAFSFLMIAVITLILSIRPSWKIFHVGLPSVFIFLLYLFFLRVIFKERRAEQSGELYKDKDLNKEVINFSVSALIIVAVGIYLPVVGKEIAQVMNWQESFVGVIFLAFVTSFPELVVSFSTARLGAFDMFLGNIAGSNIFNIGIIFFVDILYLKGDVITHASTSHATVGIIAMIMNFVVFFAVVRESKARILGLLSLNALILIVLYIINLFLAF
jgi:cation:H+ antiporter